MKRVILFIWGTLLPYVLFSQVAANNASNNNGDKTNKNISVKVEMGVLAGNNDNEKPAPFSVLGTVNLGVTQQLLIGGGVGIEFLNETGMPVFASAEYRWKKTPTTPFLFARGGYYIALDNQQKNIPNLQHLYQISSISDLDAKGGWLANAGLGYIYEANSKLTLSMALSYRYQRLSYEMDKFNYQLHADYHRLSIHFGIIF